MKKFLSLVLALVMTMSLVTISAGAEDFTDADDITYVEAVEVMSAIGVVEGGTDGNFNPTNGLTRGAAAKIICNLILGPTTASALNADTNPYPDVDKDSVFAGYIAYCQKEGIISGYADGTFKPANPLTGYAFMKMLLGALGYDPIVEGYTGANWSINVAKQAIGIGLDSGLVEDFNGSDYVTREEAMLYAFNTINARMVQYDQKTEVNTQEGVTVTLSGNRGYVTVGATSKIKGATYGDNRNYTEFAEVYFKDLSKSAPSDAFNRPTNQWKVKSTVIGTYVKSATLTYTEAVSLGTIYNDLGLDDGLATDAVAFSINGATEANSFDNNGSALNDDALVKGLLNKIGGNGALTEVFYDADNDTAIITVIDTYFGEINAAYTATATRDAYVTMSSVGNTGVGMVFETDVPFAVGEAVLYTYSNKAGDVGVQSMQTAESVTGKLGAYTANTSVTVDGNPIKANRNHDADQAITADLANAMNTEVIVYLDEYGFAVRVDAEKARNNLAVVLGYTGVGAAGTMANCQASLLFLDGTTKTVTVHKDSTDFATNDGLLSDLKINTGDIVSYRINNNGEYVLSIKADSVQMTGADPKTNVVTKGNGTINLACNAYASSATKATSANGKTVFLLNNNDVYNVYTGIANVPTVDLAETKTGKVTVYTESATPTIAKVVYIETANATVTDTNRDVIYVFGSIAVGESHDDQYNDYYEYDSIINGVIGKIKVSHMVKNPVIAINMTKDSDDIYTMTAGNATGIDGASTEDYTGDGNDDVVASGTAGSSTLYYGTGTDSVVNGTITLNSANYSVADDCQVFRIAADSNAVTPVSVDSIIYDTNDVVWFKTTNGEVTTIVIKTVDGTGAAPSSYVFTAGDLAVADGTAAGAIKVTNSTGTVIKGSAATITGLTVSVSVQQLIAGEYIEVGSQDVTAATNVTGVLAINGGNDITVGVPNGNYRVVLTLTGGDIGTLSLGNYVVTIA